MVIDSTTHVPQATSNLDQLCDVQMMFGLADLMPLLTIIHSFVKFAQLWNVYVCDFTIAVSICKLNLFLIVLWLDICIPKGCIQTFQRFVKLHAWYNLHEMDHKFEHWSWSPCFLF